jgi:hypothetical protein
MQHRGRFAAFMLAAVLDTALPAHAADPSALVEVIYYEAALPNQGLCVGSLPDAVGACVFDYFRTNSCAAWVHPPPSYSCKDPGYPGYDVASDGCVGINFCVVNFSVLRKLCSNDGNPGVQVRIDAKRGCVKDDGRSFHPE